MKISCPVWARGSITESTACSFHLAVDARASAIPLPLIVSAAVDLYGINLLKSGRSLSSALMEDAGYSGSYASRDRVHPRRRAHVMGDLEQQSTGCNCWRRIRDDRRWTASALLAL